MAFSRFSRETLDPCDRQPLRPRPKSSLSSREDVPLEVNVWSRTASAWMLGHTVTPVHPGCVTAEFELDGNCYRKHLSVESKQLLLAQTATPNAECDPGISLTSWDSTSNSECDPGVNFNNPWDPLNRFPVPEGVHVSSSYHYGRKFFDNDDSRRWKHNHLDMYSEAAQIAFVPVGYLRRLHREGRRLSRRQDLPADAYFVGLMSLPKEKNRRIYAISHPWFTREHPDPHGTQLRQLVEFFDRRGVADDELVFYDFCSLFQNDLSQLPPGSKFHSPGSHPAVRTKFEQELFELALKGMHRIYTSKQSRVIILPDIPDLHAVSRADPKLTINDRDYLSRGWCYFEINIAAAFGRLYEIYGETKEQMHNKMPYDLDRKLLVKQMLDADQFRSIVKNKKNKFNFTNKDDSDLVVTLYAKAFSKSPVANSCRVKMICEQNIQRVARGERMDPLEAMGLGMDVSESESDSYFTQSDDSYSGDRISISNPSDYCSWDF